MFPKWPASNRTTPLDATALVHEAYLKLDGERSFESKSHFLRAANAWWSYARAWLSVELGKQGE